MDEYDKHESVSPFPRSPADDESNVGGGRDTLTTTIAESPNGSEKRRGYREDDGTMQMDVINDSKSITRDGVLSWEFSEEEDVRMSQVGEISLSVDEKDVPK